MKYLASPEICFAPWLYWAGYSPDWGKEYCS